MPNRPTVRAGEVFLGGTAQRQVLMEPGQEDASPHLPSSAINPGAMALQVRDSSATSGLPSRSDMRLAAPASKRAQALLLPA